MKRILLAAVALSILAVPAYAGPASHRKDERSVRYEQRHGAPHKVMPQYRQWSKGERLSREYRGRAVDYRRHHLSAPPQGYRWVDANGSYALIGIATGIIAALTAAR